MIGGPPPCRVGPSFHDPVAGQAGQALGQHRLGDSRAPSRISVKVAQPRNRLRMIRGVQRSAKISAPRAIGQYCW